MPVPAHDVDTLRNCFRDLFGCPGREFGSRSRGVLGISDGNKGVQWNAGYPSSGVVWFGVNLEGMKYDGWPVARLIERELSRPLLLTPRYRLKVAGPGRVTARWTRDAWRHPARPPIKEADIAPTPIALDRLDRRGWEAALEGAMECLDPLRQHRGRGNVQVTLLPSKRHPWERRAEMGVSPHLKIRTPLAAITPSAMRQARDNLHALVRVRRPPVKGVGHGGHTPALLHGRDVRRHPNGRLSRPRFVPTSRCGRTAPRRCRNR